MTVREMFQEVGYPVYTRVRHFWQFVFVCVGLNPVSSSERRGGVF